MKIGIHYSNWSFSGDWIEYCKNHGIDFKVVDCYKCNIIEQINDCDLILWHHHHSITEDSLFAKQLLFAIQQSGRLVFPDFNTNWHFDDKVGQKYLLELLHAPIAPTWIFYEKAEALEWLSKTNFPKVFKLRGGAGSSNVRLVKNKIYAKRLVKKAFKRGFPSYNKLGNFKESIRLFKFKRKAILELLKSARRLIFSTQFAKSIGPQRGYVLFQEFLPGNEFDTRVVVIGERAFAIKRIVRENDFRASGSGKIIYNPKEIDLRCVKISFETSEKLKAQCVAYDIVFDRYRNPLIVEINYGFAHEAYFPCPGYWDRQLNWHEGKFNSAEWIIEDLIRKFENNLIEKGIDVK